MDQQTTVTIQAVYPPKDNRKTGSIKTAEGIYFDVWPDKMPLFQPYIGQQVPILYRGRQHNGKDYYTAVGIVGAQQPMQQAAQALPPVAAPLPPRPAPAAPVAPTNGYQAGDKEEGMFVMGVVGRAMGSGQFGATDIDVLTKAAIQAWRTRHQQARPEYRHAPSNEPPPPASADDYGTGEPWQA